MFDNIFPGLQAELKYVLTNKDFEYNDQEILKSILIYITKLEKSVRDVYNGTIRQMYMYEKQLINMIKSGKTLKMTYLNEEYAKAVPKTIITKSKLNNFEKYKDLQKMSIIILGSKSGKMVDLDTVKKNSLNESKFVQFYRCYLYAPKKKLIKFSKEDFDKISANAFNSGKSLTIQDVDNLYDYTLLTNKSYMVDDLNRMLDLLSDYRTIMERFKSPLIPKMENDMVVKRKYTRDYIFFMNRVYMNMYTASFEVFVNKMSSRISLLDKSLKDSNTI